MQKTTIESITSVILKEIPGMGKIIVDTLLSRFKLPDQELDTESAKVLMDEIVEKVKNFFSKETAEKVNNGFLKLLS